jgi:DNA polymerase-3 subunit epsilon
MSNLIQLTDYYGTTIYVHPDAIGRVDEIKTSAIIYLNLPKPVDGLVLTMDEWQRIKPMLVTAQNPQLPGSREINASSTAQTVDEFIQEEQPIAWVKVESVEKGSFYSKTSRSHRDMWRMRTADGRQFNLFDHSDPLRDHKPLIQEAGYWDLFQDMDEGQEDRWTVSPIEVELQADGSFWKCIRINRRADGADPDLTDDPDHDSSYERRDMNRPKARLFTGSPYDEIDLKEQLWDMRQAAEEVEPEQSETALERLIRVVKQGNFVILDTETTGLGADAEICQIALIDPTGKVLLNTLIAPIRPIPSDATRIHGITNDMVQGAPGWIQVNGQVWDLIYGLDVIVYNAAYDFRLLEQSERACKPFGPLDWSSLKRTCAMEAYAEHVGDWNERYGNFRWHNLEQAAKTAGYRLPIDVKAHSALGDCMMTLAVCRYLVELTDSHK